MHSYNVYSKCLATEYGIEEEKLIESVRYANELIRTISWDVFEIQDLKTVGSMIGSIFGKALEVSIDDIIINPHPKGGMDVLFESYHKAEIDRIAKRIQDLEGQLLLEKDKYIEENPRDREKVKKGWMGKKLRSRLKTISEELDCLSREKKRIYKECESGLQIKTTCGGIKRNIDLMFGDARIEFISSITWQAHHTKVSKLIGVVWDFDNNFKEDGYPFITALYYVGKLDNNHWTNKPSNSGKNISEKGTNDVTSINGKGKEMLTKILVIDDAKYCEVYNKKIKE